LQEVLQKLALHGFIKQKLIVA